VADTSHTMSREEVMRELDGLRHVVELQVGAIQQLGNERDRRYSERAEAAALAVKDALAAQEKLSGVVNMAAAKAIEKAEAAVNVRLEGMNELRSQINAERGAYLSVSTYEAKHETLVEKVDAIDDALTARLNRLENQSANLSGRFWALGVGLTLVVIAINVALHFVK
jgi:hypothetical protein